MDTSLKQRLVGAALLIALAVIFIPMFFDGASREKPVTLDMDVPPKPKYTFAEPAEASPESEPGEAKLKGERAGRDLKTKANTAGAAATAKSAEAAPGETPPGQELAPAPVTEPAPTPVEAQKAQPATESLDHPLDFSGAQKEQPATPTQVQEPASREQPMTPAQAQEPDVRDAPADEIAMVDPAVEPPNDEPQAPGDLAPPARLPGEFSSPRPGSTVWAVQVGSFSEHENAASLREDLRSSGFAAFEEQAMSEGEQVFRVMVGPEKDRKRAEALRARLRNQEDLDGIVVNSYPAAPGG